MAYPRGTPPTFKKVGSRDLHKNMIKLVGVGGVGQFCQEVVSEILETQAKNGFSRVAARFWLCTLTRFYSVSTAKKLLFEI